MSLRAPPSQLNEASNRSSLPNVELRPLHRGKRQMALWAEAGVLSMEWRLGTSRRVINDMAFRAEAGELSMAWRLGRSRSAINNMALCKQAGAFIMALCRHSCINISLGSFKPLTLNLTLELYFCGRV